MTHGDRHARWRRRLAQIAEAGRRRALRRLRPRGPVHAVLDGRDVLVACSNDYLGLAAEPLVGPSGSGGSRLISGNHPAHEALEEALGAWLERDVLLFPSGWHANVAVFATVCDRDQHMASDALNHASIIDGMRLSKARRTVVPHLDPTAIPEDADLIAVESLFSMDGDLAPLDRYPTTPWLAVDEAHAVGCLGPEGRGHAAALGLRPDILIGTFGKAFGAWGAFVAGPPLLKELLINAGRSFLYTTAPPPGLAAMLLRRLHTVRHADALRERLASNARMLRHLLRQRGWAVRGDAHIVPVLTRSHTDAIAERLLHEGVFAPAIRAPTVPAGQERIRLTVSAAHEPHHIEQIADAFGEPPS